MNRYRDSVVVHCNPTRRPIKLHNQVAVVAEEAAEVWAGTARMTGSQWGLAVVVVVVPVVCYTLLQIPWPGAVMINVPPGCGIEQRRTVIIEVSSFPALFLFLESAISQTKV